MDELEKIGRMKDLIEEIKRHNYNYYILNSPTISDYEYDKLEDELKELELETGTVLPESTSNKMRIDENDLKNVSFRKHKHIKRLYSLQKCNSIEELTDFCEDITNKYGKTVFTLEHKFDGFNLCLTYKDGELSTATTRGDGVVGELITKQVEMISCVPKKIKFKGIVEIQGEGLMNKSVFEKFNKTHEEKLVNERNAATGAIRNIDPEITRQRNLTAIFYTVNFIDDNSIKTEEDRQKFFKENGIPCPDYFHTFTNIDDAIQLINKMAIDKSYLDYQIDGMVVKVNDIALKNKLGFTNKFPKGAIAYKFPAEETTTILKDVVWQLGRTGKLTPIALLDDVFLAGATIKRATLNNEGDIRRKKIKIGSRVLIRRSNEVIPEVLGVYENTKDCKDVEIPKICPNCKHELEKIGANLFCKNPNCSAVEMDKLCHFCSRKAMNIEGVSERTVEDLYNELKVKQYHQIYDLTLDQLSAIFKLDGKDSKQAKNVIDSIEKSKHSSLANFLYALSIGGVGEKLAKVLVNNFGSLETIKNAKQEEFEAIRDIGPIVAKNIFEYFADKANLEELENLSKRGVEPSESKIVIGDALKGKTFVITGTFENYSRDNLTEKIENNGGKASSSVSKKTDYVLAGAEAGSKLKKAKDLNIKIINIDEFFEMFG